ncbi:MAG: TetR/AcrR family transcriptional regulator [Burkholderiaceae bacterium]|nr:TetR/AcrR family transcriptional regulator [Burkholderiaceae bacterium]
MRKVDSVRYEARRLEILSAAETCFVRKGFHSTAIAEICAEAGISAGHLYYYFASKEEIVAAIAQDRLKVCIKMLEHILDGPDPFAELIRQICRPKIGGLDTDSLLLELLAEAGRNPAIGESMREQSACIRRLFSGVLRKGQADGKVDAALDPDLAASILLSVVIDGMKALMVRQPDLDRGKTSDMIEVLVTRFLAAP